RSPIWSLPCGSIRRNQSCPRRRSSRTSFLPASMHEAHAMTRTFDTYLPPEQSRVRRVRLAAEVLDGVTLSRVSAGLSVTAQGLVGAPIVSAGVLFVWLEKPGRAPVWVSADPGRLPFDPQTANFPAPSENLVRVELAPQGGSPFGGGATAIRNRLI